MLLQRLNTVCRSTLRADTEIALRFAGTHDWHTRLSRESGYRNLRYTTKPDFSATVSYSRMAVALVSCVCQ